EHMIVKGGHFDAVLTKCANYRIDLAPKQHEVAGDRSFPAPRGLEIQGGRRPHRGRHFHPTVHRFLSSRDADIQHAAVDLAAVSEYLLDLLRVDPKILSGRRASRRWTRRFGERERVMDCLSHLYRITVS